MLARPFFLESVDQLSAFVHCFASCRAETLEWPAHVLSSPHARNQLGITKRGVRLPSELNR